MRRFTHTFPQRISAFLLCLALCLGLLPSAAFALDGDKTIMLGTSGISGFDTAKGGTGYDYIYFGSWTAQDTYTTSGPIKWRVLDDQTNFDSDSDGTNDAGLFLLSDGLLGTGNYGGVYFQQNYHYDSSSDKYHKGSTPSGGDHTNCQIANAWQGSDAQAWCETFYSSNLTTQEQGAVLATTKSDGEFTSSTYRIPFAASNDILNGDKVFFLSAEEAETSGYGFGNGDDRKANYGSSAGVWWLRSPHAYSTLHAGAVGDLGLVDFRSVCYDRAARPAFNLDLNSVLFTSAAVGGKSPAAESEGSGTPESGDTQSGDGGNQSGGGNQGGGDQGSGGQGSGGDQGGGDNQSGEDADAIFEIDSYNGNEWKLTLLDEAHKNFEISNATINGSDNTIAFSYSGAQTGTNEYISVVIENNGAITHYGRILQPESASGTASLTLPAGVTLGDTTKLYVFNEQYNGDKMTDYASQLKEISPTLDETAPKLSNGSATRDSETTATVKFTSDEAGSYYYVVDNNATAPDSIDISGEGTSCSDDTETTISLNSLPGEYIHIVVKDAVNNVSDILTIQIPAYTYTLTVNLNGGSGNTTGGVYPAGEVVNIDAGSRNNYRFTGWTTSNGGSFADASSANTTFTMPAADTTITANWQYDSPYIPPTKPDGPSTGTSDGWEDIREEIADADRGDTIAIDMNGETEVPAEIFEEVAGKDVTVEFELEDGISWTVNGQDIPTATDFSDLDLGVDMGTSGITVDVINTVTGELGSVQITLAHDGEFGFALTLTAPLGKENAGYWANLYHYDEDAKTLNYETSAQVASDGTASLRMTHASQYAIVIDDKSHDLPFTDLGENQWYESAVRYAYTHDIMEGMSATKFSPNISLTRAQAVQVLYNLEGRPAVSGNAAFPDLVEKWYKPAIAWAEQTGVVDGYEDGTFRPGQPVNRMEFAQMLYNYAKYKGYDLTAQGDLTAFPDGDSVQPWAETAMTWATGNELINGHDDGTLEPGGTTTRAQAASILMKFDQNVVEN